MRKEIVKRQLLLLISIFFFVSLSMEVFAVDLVILRVGTDKFSYVQGEDVIVTVAVEAPGSSVQFFEVAANVVATSPSTLAYFEENSLVDSKSHASYLANFITPSSATLNYDDSNQLDYSSKVGSGYNKWFFSFESHADPVSLSANQKVLLGKTTLHTKSNGLAMGKKENVVITLDQISVVNYLNFVPTALSVQVVPATISVRDKGACAISADCTAGDECVNSVCVNVIPKGGVCSYGDVCAEGIACVQGKCQGMPSCYDDDVTNDIHVFGRVTGIGVTTSLDTCTSGNTVMEYFCTTEKQSVSNPDYQEGVDDPSQEYVIMDVSVTAELLKNCNIGEACDQGICTLNTCVIPKPNLCKAQCTDFVTDVNNCGSCGNSCLGFGVIGASCTAGQCVVQTCESGFKLINNQCVAIPECEDSDDGKDYLHLLGTVTLKDGGTKTDECSGGQLVEYTCDATTTTYYDDNIQDDVTTTTWGIKANPQACPSGDICSGGVCIPATTSFDTPTNLLPNGSIANTNFVTLTLSPVKGAVHYDFRANDADGTFNSDVTKRFTSTIDGVINCNGVGGAGHYICVNGVKEPKLTVSVIPGHSYYWWVDVWDATKMLGTKGVSFTVQLPVPTTETHCADGKDDDMDSQIDCADTDCVTSSSCTTLNCPTGTYAVGLKGSAGDWVEGIQLKCTDNTFSTGIGVFNKNQFDAVCPNSGFVTGIRTYWYGSFQTKLGMLCNAETTPLIQFGTLGIANSGEDTNLGKNCLAGQSVIGLKLVLFDNAGSVGIKSLGPVVCSNKPLSSVGGACSANTDCGSGLSCVNSICSAGVVDGDGDGVDDSKENGNCKNTKFKQGLSIIQSGIFLGCIRGDSNSDGTVDIKDYSPWLSSYMIYYKDATKIDVLADMNNDNKVDIKDYSPWLSSYMISK